MPTEKSAELVRYLVSASRAGLGSFTLERMNRAANLQREIGERLEQLAEELGWAWYAQLLREHGEELAEELGAPRRRRRLK